MLNWSVKQLAERGGLSCAVIRRLEEYNDTPPASDELLQGTRLRVPELNLHFRSLASQVFGPNDFILFGLN